MAPSRKRENRENQFYDVGVQGRKTGITLADKGLRDEHGLEPISGIFSSPEKSPPKRVPSSRTGGTVTDSESMEIQESSIPDLATSAHLLRSSRTHFPPPKSRSPMKTALGSSPRRQSSMGPRSRSVNPTSSPSRAASHPAVSRRLDFEQDESSLQETPALSGSGQRRGKRRDIYDIEPSPSRAQSAVLEESIQEEIIATEDSAMLNGMAEDTYIADIGNDTVADEPEATVDEEESEVVPQPSKQPSKRGRKRKSDAIQSATEELEEAPKTRTRGAAPAQALQTQKKGKKAAVAAAAQPRRSKRVSELTEEEPSNIIDTSTEVSDQIETPPVVAAKGRGRPPKAKLQDETEAPAKKQQKPKEKQKELNEEPVFKKPKLSAKAKKAGSKADEPVPEKATFEGGKLVDIHGKPISQTDIDQMSTTSVGSRYGRGRHLSVFRELEPESVARVGRTGRHRVPPIDFWKNESIAYDPVGSMQAIVKNEQQDPVRKRTNKSRGKKRGLATIEEDELTELDPWEEQDGVFVGIFRDFDPVTEVTMNELVETNIAWAQKGINPVDVADASFKFTKLASAGDESFLSWGFIELLADQMKRTKNARRMHMVFHVQNGAVEVKIHENVFTVHRGGVFQVPRGNTYSIKNVATGTTRIFFAQGWETRAQIEE